MKTLSLVATALIISGCGNSADLERARSQQADLLKVNAALRREIRRLKFDLIQPLGDFEINMPNGLPSSPAAADATPAEIVVSLCADGRSLLDGAVVDRQTLEDRLKLFAERNRDGELRIKCDRRVKFKHVLKLVVGGHRAGIHNIYFSLI